MLAQWVKYLLCKCEDLSSNSDTHLRARQGDTGL